jgi:hypothetical protein
MQDALLNQKQQGQQDMWQCMSWRYLVAEGLAPIFCCGQAMLQHLQTSAHLHHAGSLG